MAGMWNFPTVDKCPSADRSNQTVVADLDGTLLRGRSSFAYFALVAFEAGGALRLLFLVLATPVSIILSHCVSESEGIKVLVFATLVGMKVSDIESVARAVLPKFYSSDLHPEAWRVFSSCGRRCVFTSYPRVMVEAFLKEYLEADVVVGTEISICNGRATGFVRDSGVLCGDNKADAVKKAFTQAMPEIGLGGRTTDFPFLSLCKEAYMVPRTPEVEPVQPEDLPKPIIFHDGRLVQRPTPLSALLTVLWMPLAFLVACIRIIAAVILPMSWFYYGYWALGVRLTIKGTPPPRAQKSTGLSGVLFICCHRTLLDPIMVSNALGRSISTVTYSLSRVSELFSPVKTYRLTRDRVKDGAMIKKLLEKGDLVICPEGTTCREPFLLRFSAMFAELTNEIVPVAMVNGTTMFHGTTARGWKGMDLFYYMMNPSPTYEVTFLGKLPQELTCGGGKSSHEVANYIQRLIGAHLGYRCTDLTRKDKYLALAGNDGLVNVDPKSKVHFARNGGLQTFVPWCMKLLKGFISKKVA